MVVTLFDKVKPEIGNLEPALYTESWYIYLSKSDRDRFREARGTLDKWFSKYFSKHPKDALELKQRFQSTDDTEHIAALTELYVFNLLNRNSYEVQPHPIVANGRQPDFLVYQGKKPVLYLEVATIFGRKVSRRGGLFVKQILDAVNKVNSPKFLISVDFKTINSLRQPSLAKIVKYLNKKVAESNYDEISANKGQLKTHPKHVWEHDGWHIEFRMISVRRDRIKERNKASRVVGSWMNVGGHISTDEEIIRTIRKKVIKYGQLSLPFVVFTNIVSDSIFCDDDMIEDALLGKHTITMTGFDTSQPGRISHGRTFKGLFGNPRSPTNTRLSGVVTVAGLVASTLRTVTPPTFWPHPEANKPLNNAWLKLRVRDFTAPNAVGFPK